MLTGDIEDEVRYGIDDISRRGLGAPDEDRGTGGYGGRGGPAWRLAGGGGRGGQGADLFGILLAWLDALAGLAGAVLALLRRI